MGAVLLFQLGSDGLDLGQAGFVLALQFGGEGVGGGEVLCDGVIMV